MSNGNEKSNPTPPRPGQIKANPKRVLLIALVLVLFFGGRFVYSVNQEFGEAAPLAERLAAEQARPKPKPESDPIVLAVQEAERWINEGRAEEGVVRIRELAEAGHAVAQRRLGVLYEKGKGVNQSIEAAIEWYQKAVDQGDLKAMHNIGLLYDFGRGVEKNPDRAIKYYLMSAKEGHAQSQGNLGAVYRDQGDMEEAIKWFKLASKGGRRGADYLLMINGETYYGPPVTVLEKLCIVVVRVTSNHANNCYRFQ